MYLFENLIRNLEINSNSHNKNYFFDKFRSGKSTEELILKLDPLVNDISLQTAATIVSDDIQNINKYLSWLGPYDYWPTLKRAFSERDFDCSQVNGNFLPERTQKLIHFLFLILRKNNFTLYGTKPSSSNKEGIPFEEMREFDREYKVVHSEMKISEENISFENVTVKREELLMAIEKIDHLQLDNEQDFRKYFRVEDGCNGGYQKNSM